MTTNHEFTITEKEYETLCELAPSLKELKEKELEYDLEKRNKETIEELSELVVKAEDEVNKIKPEKLAAITDIKQKLTDENFFNSLIENLDKQLAFIKEHWHTHQEVKKFEEKTEEEKKRIEDIFNELVHQKQSLLERFKQMFTSAKPKATSTTTAKISIALTTILRITQPDCCVFIVLLGRRFLSFHDKHVLREGLGTGLNTCMVTPEEGYTGIPDMKIVYEMLVSALFSLDLKPEPQDKKIAVHFNETNPVMFRDFYRDGEPVKDEPSDGAFEIRITELDKRIIGFRDIIDIIDGIENENVEPNERKKIRNFVNSCKGLTKKLFTVEHVHVIER